MKWQLISTPESLEVANYIFLNLTTNWERFCRYRVWPPKVVFLFKFYQSSSCRNAYKVIISSAIYGLDKLKAVKAARPRLPTQRY